jgi:hypothetical protein
MKIAKILFAGAVFSSAIFAQQGDPGAAERFRMKFGRSIAGQPSTTHTQTTQSNCDCCHGKHSS